MSNYLQQTLSDEKYNLLRSILDKVPTNADSWASEHTNALIKMVTRPMLDSLTKDALQDVDERLKEKNQAFWFLYDNLEDDLKGEIREKALTGLFQLVQNSYTRRLRALRFKIFLSEDIWSLLTFDNKKYFQGRDVLLQWTYTDFLRLALRQALGSEKFKNAVNRFSPVESIDQASEDVLNETLQILWGGHWDQNSKFLTVSEWLKNRLSDGSQTTFPNSLHTLLKEAVKSELHTNVAESAKDRLLSLKSLHQGLIKASQARCNEIYEMYPELKPFFETLAGNNPEIEEDDLQKIWQEKAQMHLPHLKNFENFVTFLQGIGLIDSILSIGENGFFYSVANIYIYGFRMKPQPYAEP